MAALARPGRDPREDTPPPLTRKHVAKLSDLAIGSIVKGRVQNVVDFGAFIDIGLKTSGFAHRSELSDKRFRHPLDVVAVGDIVEAEIISIDEARNRIGLSLKRAAARNKNSERGIIAPAKLLQKQGQPQSAAKMKFAKPLRRGASVRRALE